MARILNSVDGRWYEELRTVAYYVESDLEKWILQHSRSIFPQHFVFPFKRSVLGETAATSRRPDLAIVRRDFSAWSIIEVEIEGHELRHVLEQTRVFAEGNYNVPEMADYAHKQLNRISGRAISLERITNLLADHVPSVLVIADMHTTDWQEKLNAAGVEFCVFEVYKNASGQYVYRTFGQFPAVRSEEAHCRTLRGLPNVIEVIGGFEFKKIRKDKRVEVDFDERLTRWVLFNDEGRQYLRFVGTVNPLSPNAEYGLFRDKANRYYFRRS